MRRFWERVEKTDDCWLWRGAVNRKGYGKFQLTEPTIDDEGLFVRRLVEQLAHRTAYRLTVGEIPEGAAVHHSCKNPACVRPDHLELMEPGAHSRQHRTANGTHCKRGHPFDEENTYIRKNGTRWCLACSYERKRREKAR